MVRFPDNRMDRGEIAVDDLLTTKEAADFLGFHEQSLKRWRMHDEGPRYLKLGARKIRYRRADLEAFVAAGEVKTDR